MTAQRQPERGVVGGDVLSLGRRAKEWRRFGDRYVLEERQRRFDAVASRVLHELRWRIKSHRLRIEQPAKKRRRMVALEPCRGIGEQRETRRVRFGEPVFAEAEDLLVDLARELLRVAAFAHSVDE